MTASIKNNKNTLALKTENFLGKVFLVLVSRNSLHQKYGEVLIYLITASAGERKFIVPVPNIIGNEIGISFLRVRSALKELELIGAISISKKYSRSSVLHISLNYNFKKKKGK